jgi:predicted RNA-binding Zn ribbon-like protein
MLIGGHGALDFLNSVFTPAERPVDHLATGAAMASWLQASAVLPAALNRVLGALPTAEADRLAADARALREGFRATLQRWTQGGAAALSPADLAPLNAWMAQGPLLRRLERSAQGLVLASEPTGSHAAAVMAALAGLCADLLLGHGPEQVRRCENPSCTLWFADTKRGPRRRWCSMAACGNRHKVAAHRARARGAPEATGPA